MWLALSGDWSWELSALEPSESCELTAALGKRAERRAHARKLALVIRTRHSAMGIASSKRKPKRAAEAEFVGGVQLVGRRVMVKNLYNRPELNGLPGTIRRWIPSDPYE